VGHPREQNGGFIGFGAGIREKALLQVPWRDLRDLLCQCHDVFVGIERRRVLQPVDLRVHFAGDLRVAVPHGDGQDAAEEIEVPVAVKIPQVLHLAAVGDERLLEVVGHRGPKVFLVFGDDFFAARAAGELGCRNGMCGCRHE